MKCVNPRSVYNKHTHLYTLVGCGKCIMCRIARVNDWEIRLKHEAYYYKVNEMCYITLTYEDDNIKDVNKRDCQLFIKRLRKTVERYDERGKLLEESKIKYFLGAEYGEESGRAHYHAIIYGYYPDDLKYYKRSKSGYKLYTSESLYNIWKHGFVTVGHVSKTSINYVVSYMLGKDSRKTDRTAEFSIMSQGIGKKYLFEHFDHYKQKPFILCNGNKIGLPRYYVKKLEQSDEEKMAQALNSEIVGIVRRNISVEGWQPSSLKLPEEYEIERRIVESNVQAEKNLKSRRGLTRKKSM